jgi:putative tricarboxylic transport membrane protein
MSRGWLKNMGWWSCLCIGILGLSLLPQQAAAAYPDRAITLVIPWPAGGATDMLGRIIASEAEKLMGQNVVVVNKVGGGGAVGHTFGAQAKPDGYTITLATTEASTVHLLGLSPFSYKDFDPLMLIATGPSGLGVLTNSPYKSFKDFQADAKKKPGQLKVSSIAVGGIWNLCAIGISKKAGIQLNILPYAGGGPAVVAALGGHVDASMVGFSEILPQAREKKMRFLGITAAERHGAFPEAPTFKEQGIDLDLGAWWGICIPKNTPADIKSKIHENFKKAVQSEKVKNMLAQRGFIFNYKGPDEFNAWLGQMDKAFREIIGK